MLQLLWNMFKESGQINVYMLYKALERSYQEDFQNDKVTDDSIMINKADISAGLDA